MYDCRVRVNGDEITVWTLNPFNPSRTLPAWEKLWNFGTGKFPARQHHLLPIRKLSKVAHFSSPLLLLITFVSELDGAGQKL